MGWRAAAQFGMQQRSGRCARAAKQAEHGAGSGRRALNCLNRLRI
jgi:hypothetical protein